MEFNIINTEYFSSPRFYNPCISLLLRYLWFLIRILFVSTALSLITRVYFLIDFNILADNIIFTLNYLFEKTAMYFLMLNSLRTPFINFESALIYVN